MLGKFAAFAGMVVVGGLIAAAPAAAAPVPAAPLFSGWICAGTPVPAGHVITSIRQDSGCGGRSWFVRLPENGLWICESSVPIPSGYVVTAIRQDSGCLGNSWFIRFG
ncbi:MULTISPECIES: hypothetical protein [unclassified Crossiella]|uniref:hypothetical protein n=1 Tax=unclassified Crossiella TaxID=2620835 RepID=UPI001FFFE1EF|nr:MULTISPECIES: hypothetical protein [unclassified Crossiella]MCK2244380.1 hypothetical protein [Crossiella sp. S99.2]MCK2257792.1 hypothetical protein [Crossiella sp. S99.1]